MSNQDKMRDGHNDANDGSPLSGGLKRNPGTSHRTPTMDPNRSTDPQKQRDHQGGRGTGDQDKGSQGGEDENDHGDQVKHPKS